MDERIRFKRPYLDSSFYIAAINGEPERAICKDILDAAERSELEIVASTWVLAEVIKTKGENTHLSSDTELKIDALFKSKHIKWYELDTTLAVEARHVARKYGLRPADAVHLATALKAKADVLLRWNGRFNGLQNDVIRVCDPYWYGESRMFDLGAN